MEAIADSSNRKVAARILPFLLMKQPQGLGIVIQEVAVDILQKIESLEPKKLGKQLVPNEKFLFDLRKHREKWLASVRYNHLSESDKQNLDAYIREYQIGLAQLDSPGEVRSFMSTRSKKYFRRMFYKAF